MDFQGIPSLQGLDRAIAVIVVSEIGDKTFLIAAILSMRHPRTTIFAGAFLALAVMSLLSSLLGTILPSLLPKRYTTAAAALLFFVFGAKMMQEGIEMEAGEKGREKMAEEMREVQKEVEVAEEEVVGRKGGANLDDMEEGRLEVNPMDDIGRSSNNSSPATTPSGQRRSSSRRESIAAPSKATATVTGITEGAKNLAHLFFSPIFVQAFILTFLAEWGDRSQITTIALAAAHNVWLVTLGTTLGHSFCTLLAVLGGRWISQHISIKHVTLGGAVLFLIFGVVYSYEAWNWDEAAELVAAVTSTPETIVAL
ncbi:Ca2+/H+ antiporter, TMEM165/GDT1 family, partial [Phenoliferia sp. Uapishka_3]